MKIEEIPIRETRWSGQSRFLQHSPYGEEVWRSSRKRGNGSGCSRIIPGRHLICSGWWRQSVTAWITAAA